MQAGSDVHECILLLVFLFQLIFFFFSRDEREVQFHCSRLALLSVLRSWPGLLHFCHPANSSGLRSLVNVLYLKQLEVRVSIERVTHFSGLKFLCHNSSKKCACVSY